MEPLLLPFPLPSLGSLHLDDAAQLEDTKSLLQVMALTSSVAYFLALLALSNLAILRALW